MISSIEVENFKGFRHLKLEGLERFHVLVGANGSGKSTFLEVVEFVKDLMLFDVQEAVSRRGVSSLRQLAFLGQSGHIKLNITLDPSLFDGECVFYTLWLMESAESGVEITHEYLRKLSPATRPILSRSNFGPAYYAREDGSEGQYTFPINRSALAQVPPDETLYPTANRVKKLLSTGIQLLRLDSRLMGAPCPPSLPATEFLPDGGNLARVAGRFLRGPYNDWIEHLRLALEDLDDILWRQREDDRAEYLVLRYRNGVEIPSWLASFGTLRTLALTLPAFLRANEPTVRLFEEPENGIHPKAIEIVVDAIKSIPNAQTFVTTHSPMIVQQVGIDSLLLFSKRGNEIVIEHGRDNKILHELDGVPDLATVFASRVLG